MAAAAAATAKVGCLQVKKGSGQVLDSGQQVVETVREEEDWHMAHFPQH